MNQLTKPISKLGFTGTRVGMSKEQWLGCVSFIQLQVATGATIHHGSCRGSDEQFGWIAHTNRLFVVVHPPYDPKWRSYCYYDEMRDPKAYLERDYEIVDETEYMLATPNRTHPMPYGGTDSTLRYAASLGRPGTVILPRGTVLTLPEYLERTAPVPELTA